MTQFRIDDKPVGHIPVLIPLNNGENMIYGDVHFVDGLIVIKPKSDGPSFTEFLERNMVVGLTISLPEIQGDVRHPFMDGWNIERPEPLDPELARLQAEKSIQNWKAERKAAAEEGRLPSHPNLIPNPSMEHFDGAIKTVVEESYEGRKRRLERSNAQAEVIDLILSHRNHASDEQKLLQIRTVME